MLHALVDLDETLVYAERIGRSERFRVSVRPGVHAFLRNLRELNGGLVRVDLYTAGNTVYTDDVLAQSGLRGRLDNVWTKDKPIPKQAGEQHFRVLFDNLEKGDPSFNAKSRRLIPFVHVQVGEYLGKMNPSPTLREAFEEVEWLLANVGR